MNLYRDFHRQEDIDFQYDCESSLNMPPILDWLVRNSRQARSELDCYLDQRFGPTVDETVDVFPSKQPGSPIVVFVHGGWWRVTTNKEWSLVARGLVGNGITVALTNYSLCPKVSIEEITRQTRAALVWLYHNAQRFNANRDRIYVAGHSAGGQQVGMVALTNWVSEYGLPANLVKGGISISGLFDLRPFRHSWLQPKLQLDHDTIDRQSPLFHIPINTSSFPMIITLGGDESHEFHRQSNTFAEAWQANGGHVQILDQPGKNHFSVIEGFEDTQSAICRAVCSFVNA